LALTSAKPEEVRIESLRRRDDIIRPNSLITIEDTPQDEKTAAIITLINDNNSANHLIRILGQLIRNFYGSMKGDRQVELIRECYSLCLRMMTVMYELLEQDKEEIATVMAHILLMSVML
jgi:hypothetical protein